MPADRNGRIPGKVAEAPAASSTTRGAVVEFRHVCKTYASKADARARSSGFQQPVPAAVDDLSLIVPAGEICVLVGPSGCGKTTTLKMVNRLIEPESGQVLIDGQDVAREEATALRRRIGYVIQQVGLFPHHTIGENVATVPRLLGWSLARTRARVDELLTLVGLDPARYLGRYPSQLSGGERQRVGVARALAVEPPVILMDEPFGAVDPLVRERLQDEFLSLHRRLGTTVLFVTHDINEAVKLGDRVAVMQEGGHLAQYAPPADLLLRPASPFVARFVGADRALKRLALLTVAEVPLDPVPEARAGEHPLALLTRQTSLRDAVSFLLTAPSGVGLVVDEAGAPLGVLSLDTVRAMLQPQAGEPLSVASGPETAERTLMERP